MREFQLKITPEISAGQLEAFYLKRGEARLLPNINRVEKSPYATVVAFYVVDRDGKALIMWEPSQKGGSLMTIFENESERWGWRLGESELGVNTYLAAETSSRCAAFCDSFVKYLEDKRLMGAPSFLSRNKDDLLKLVISAFLGGLFGGLFALLAQWLVQSFQR